MGQRKGALEKMELKINSIYRGRKVLVTGHTGFKGAWLTQMLLEMGAEVIGFSLQPPTMPNLFTLLELEKEINHNIGDVRNYSSFSTIIESFKPEIIFHLAAQPMVRESYKNPRFTYETNVMGVVNLFEAVRQTTNTKVVVNVTSDKCYENKEWLWGYREDDAMGGHDPYSSSKGCSELASAAFMNSFFHPQRYGRDHETACATARAGNVIGGGDWGKDRLLPDIVKAFSKNEKVAIRYPEAIRPWQHVLEPISGYLLLGARLFTHGPEFCGAWNFGPLSDEAWTVLRVTQKLADMWEGAGYSVDSSDHPHEAGWLKLDCSKALVRLNWKPSLSTKEALEMTAAWYSSYYKNQSNFALSKNQTRKQIHDYMNYTEYFE